MFTPTTRPYAAERSDTAEGSGLRSVYVVALSDDAALVADHEGRVTPVPLTELRLDWRQLAELAGGPEPIPQEPALAGRRGWEPGGSPADSGRS